MATRYLVPYVVGDFLSSGPAKLSGTGAEIGRLNAETRNAPLGLVVWNTIVNLFGVWMPGIGPPL